MRPILKQRRILLRMRDGAVIATDYRRRFVLTVGNDAIEEVSRPILRALKASEWIAADPGRLCWTITAAGRTALED